VVAKAEVAEDASDFSAAAKVVANAKPQAVVVVSVSGPAPKIVQAYRAIDEGASLYGLSILSSDALYQSLGDKVRGMIITQTAPYPWDRSIRVAAEYQDVMKAAGIKEISVAGMEGFVAARMLVEALKTAGKSPTAESFTKVLENSGEQDLGGYRYRFSANDHSATRYVDITLIGKGGKLLR
jgi:ABC-type branched-subunit amino acid transport system substrate-binding protein